jgi:hypothetical protein
MSSMTFGGFAPPPRLAPSLLGLLFPDLQAAFYSPRNGTTLIFVRTCDRIAADAA